MADVLIYPLRLSDDLGVDRLAAAQEKVAANRQRYTVERSTRSARKVE